jgi:hypothetical protein
VTVTCIIFAGWSATMRYGLTEDSPEITRIDHSGASVFPRLFIEVSDSPAPFIIRYQEIEVTRYPIPSGGRRYELWLFGLRIKLTKCDSRMNGQFAGFRTRTIASARSWWMAEGV